MSAQPKKRETSVDARVRAIAKRLGVTPNRVYRGLGIGGSSQRASRSGRTVQSAAAKLDAFELTLSVRVDPLAKVYLGDALRAVEILAGPVVRQRFAAELAARGAL